MNNVRGVIFLLAMAMVWFSCRKSASNEKQIFRYNDLAGITSLDPAFANNLSNIWAVQQLYNSLLQFDDNLQIQPCIAKRWEASDDNTLFTCYLRDDVYFHPAPCFTGPRKLVASDVQFTFNRLLQTGNATWVTSYIQRNENDSLLIDCPNDSTVTFHLQRSFMPFVQILALPMVGIVPEEALIFYGQDFGRNPVGTGPFLMKRWVENEKLVLSKNNSYFECDSLGNSLPYIDGVAISFIKDPQTVLLGFMTGSFDMLSGMEKPYRETLVNEQGDLKTSFRADMDLLRIPFLNTEYIGFNLTSEPNHSLRYPQVRQALHLVLDKQMITKYVRRDVGIPAYQGFLPPSLQVVSWPTRYDRPNRTTALQLLQEVGYEHPSMVDPFTLYCDPLSADVYTQLVNQWRREGFRVKLEVIDRPTLRSQLAKGQLLCFRASWIADFPDPNTYLSLFYSPNFSPRGPNYTHFHNVKADQLFEQSMSETDDSLRMAMYREMYALVEAESPVIPVYYDEVIRFVRHRVSGLGINAMNLLLLKSVKIQS